MGERFSASLLNFANQVGANDREELARMLQERERRARQAQRSFEVLAELDAQAERQVSVREQVLQNTLSNLNASLVQQSQFEREQKMRQAEAFVRQKVAYDNYRVQLQRDKLEAQRKFNEYKTEIAQDINKTSQDRVNDIERYLQKLPLDKTRPRSVSFSKEAQTELAELANKRSRLDAQLLNDDIDERTHQLAAAQLAEHKYRILSTQARIEDPTADLEEFFAGNMINLGQFGAGLEKTMAFRGPDGKIELISIPKDRQDRQYIPLGNGIEIDPDNVFADLLDKGYAPNEARRAIASMATGDDDALSEIADAVAKRTSESERDEPRDPQPDEIIDFARAEGISISDAGGILRALARGEHDVAATLAEAAGVDFSGLGRQPATEDDESTQPDSESQGQGQSKGRTKRDVLGGLMRNVQGLSQIPPFNMLDPIGRAESNNVEGLGPETPTREAIQTTQVRLQQRFRETRTRLEQAQDDETRERLRREMAEIMSQLAEAHQNARTLR